LIQRSYLLATGLLFLALATLPGLLGADIVQPVSVQLREQEPNTYLVQWSVPQTYPVRAIPEPVLPEDCQARGERLLQERPGTWFNQQTFQCADSIAGRDLGIRYPFVVAGQSSMMRVALLSGEQLVHALNPGEDTWSVPEIDAGFTANLWPNLQRAVVDGVRHFFGGWLHLALWLTLAILAGVGGSVRCVTGFSVGQLLGLLATLLFGVNLPPALAEGGLALAVILLANEMLKPADRRRQLLGLSLVAGLAHGAGLGSLMSPPASFVGLEWLYLLLVVLSMDSVLLVLGFVARGFRHLVPSRSLGRSLTKGLAYGVGALGVASIFLLLPASPSVEADDGAGQGRLPSLPGAEGGSGMPDSRRVAAAGVRAPIQSFVSIEAFEVRHQVLLRLRDLRSEMALESTETLAIEEQPDIKERLQGLVLPLAEVTIDGVIGESLVDRIDFLIVESTGVLPRPEPVVERVEEAFLGITLVYVTSRTPDRVALTWQIFPRGIEAIPATASDPEFSNTVNLTPQSPTSVWENNLSVDLVPTVTAVSVEPRVLPLPLAALPLLAMSVFFLIAAGRGRAAINLAWVRVALAVALVVAPIGEVAIALPSSAQSLPSVGEARRILAGVLPNVYRAFEFREESAAYDRLAVSVTGDTLSEIYLEHRRALEMEERGGARARVEAVEVQEVRSVSPLAGGGFEADAIWVVGGTVTHFGHRHFRQNRYDARVSLVPSGGTWKIRSIELFDEERIR
jgi:hypothetical protein